MILPYYLKEKKQKKQSIKGLGHFLSGQAQLSEIIFSTQYPGLNLIFAGHCPPNPVELLSGDRFRQLITYGKEKFDYVIVDAPPIGSVVDLSLIHIFHLPFPNTNQRICPLKFCRRRFA